MINHGLSQNAHMSILGNAIRASRQARGMTQAELGERFGISKAAVAMWESGKNIPDQRKMAELTRVLDLDPAVAIGLHDDRRAHLLQIVPSFNSTSSGISLSFRYLCQHSLLY